MSKREQLVLLMSELCKFLFKILVTAAAKTTAYDSEDATSSDTSSESENDLNEFFSFKESEEIPFDVSQIHFQFSSDHEDDESEGHVIRMEQKFNYRIIFFLLFFILFLLFILFLFHFSCS